MRIGIAGFMHESNTFNPIRADRDAFVRQSLLVGEAVRAEWAAAHHEVGGFFAAAAELGFAPVPLGMAWATPSGPVTADVFDEVTALLVDQLRRERLDGLLLALHGAMVADGHLDADAEVLARVRAAVGRDFPLAVTLDLHGNLPPRFADLTDLAVAYRTNPHVDQHECGRRAARLLVRQLRGEIRPRLALATPPLLINIMRQDTSCEPLAGFMAGVRRLEAEPGVLAASLLPGFAYADVPQMGPAVVVVTDGDAELARRHADRIAADLWKPRAIPGRPARRGDGGPASPSRRSGRRWCWWITGDNIGGGSAGDGTVLLAELLRQEATGWVVMLYAPDEVTACAAAGVGGRVTLRVGGKVDRFHGDPVEVAGVVRVLHDGRYVEPAVRHGGKRVNRMGLTALVELPGDSLLALTSERHPPFSLGALTCLGVRPELQRMVVVKAAIAYKAAYAPIAGTMIEVETPGRTCVNPARLTYRHIRRPLWPLD
ncbi:MAG: M81 family metallopeptidase [Gemmataceae bacterium]